MCVRLRIKSTVPQMLLGRAQDVREQRNEPILIEPTRNGMTTVSDKATQINYAAFTFHCSQPNPSQILHGQSVRTRGSMGIRQGCRMTNLDGLMNPTSVWLSGYGRGVRFPHIHSASQPAERSRLGIVGSIPRNQNRAPPASPETQIR